MKRESKGKEEEKIIMIRDEYGKFSRGVCRVRIE
jgi:hypothetical protein